MSYAFIHGSKMLKAARLFLAPAIVVTAAIGAASAQTVIVRGAPPGSTVEYVLNTATIGSAAADATGDATLPAPDANAVKGDVDASIYVDTCDTLRRVVVLARGVAAPPEQPGCRRNQIAGLFLVRRVSTLVVNVAGPNPTVLLRQGPVDLSAPARNWALLPTGLVLFGGGGFTTFGDTRTAACGDVTDCSGGDGTWAYTAGAAFWLSRFLAAEVSYLKPGATTVSGTGTTFRFDTDLEADVVALTGKVGGPLGPVRLYGQAGVNYTRATFGTTQTVNDTTRTIDGVSTVVSGGTVTYELKTAGWGWLFGGGLEIWVKPRFALYADGGRMALKGSAGDDAEGTLDERVNFILLGLRVSVGR